MKKIIHPILKSVGFCFLFLAILSCNEAKDKKNKNAVNNIPSTKENFNDLFLDSNALVTFFKENKLSDSTIKEVTIFYEERNFQCAWINSTGLTQAANNFYEQLQNYKDDFQDSRFLNVQLDSLIENIQDNEKQFLGETKNVEKLELLLTTTFFKYAKKVYGGITQESKNLRWYIPRNKKDYQALLDSLVSNNENLEEPVNRYYSSLKEKLKQYRAIEKKGEFSSKITFKETLSFSDIDSCISEVKLHLFTTGDLKENDKTDLFTDSVQKALMHYQKRFGLKETGKLDAATINEMNKPIAYRIKQIMVNMERLRWVPAEVENDYLLVNIPEYKLHIFENDRLAWETNVVVGKVLTQTIIFKGNISQIVLNPYWNVPNSIYRKEIKGRGTNYLKRNNMERFNGGVRQKPGPNNSLGRVKFLFPNNFNIYLHDTPSKSLFGENKRGFSHGCIRVQDPFKLALYLLRKDKTWTNIKIDSILGTNKEHPINLAPTMPVYIAYFTTWVDSKGELNFRNDIYNLDEKLAKEIFGK
jgi:L,D-transpeptidase YcbB